MNGPHIIRTCEPLHCCDEVWEAAYLRFETPEEEVAKFVKRLNSLGAAAWPRDAKIVDIFCGRGNGLIALQRLGFTNLVGVDLSERLLQQFQGHGTLYVADCRALPMESDSCDIVIVQGGLHHLPLLPDDLRKTLQEVRRVLRPGGRLVAVEPWLTPFLHFVHALCHVPLLRRAWKHLDALATMIDRERETYENWLNSPQSILECMDRELRCEQRTFAFGKMNYVGVKS